MAKSQLSIYHKKDNILFRLIRPVEIIVSAIFLIALLSLFLVAALNILDCITLAKDFNNIDVNTMTVDDFKKLYNSGLTIESNIKSALQSILHTSFGVLITYFIVRICANGLLLFREWHDCHKWTHKKGLFIFNVIKRALLILVIIVVLSLASSINKLIDDQLYSPINNILNTVEGTLNQVTDILPQDGINGITQQWLTNNQAKLQNIFDSLTSSEGALQKNITILTDTIKGTFLTDVMKKGIALIVFEVIWFLLVVILCSISKAKSNSVNVSVNEIDPETKSDKKEEK